MKLLFIGEENEDLLWYKVRYKLKEEITTELSHRHIYINCQVFFKYRTISLKYETTEQLNGRNKTIYLEMKLTSKL